MVSVSPTSISVSEIAFPERTTVPSSTSVISSLFISKYFVFASSKDMMIDEFLNSASSPLKIKALLSVRIISSQPQSVTYSAPVSFSFIV